MPRVQHASDKVLDYFRTADLGQVELVLHWVRLIVKERQPKKAAGAVRTRKARPRSTAEEIADANAVRG